MGITAGGMEDLTAEKPDRRSFRRRGDRILHFWRSPEGQPRWARPALLLVTALAGLAYAWNLNSAFLEPFYGAAARSMALSWHNFIFGAADPWGTISVDKLPGALWLQALSLRIFGFHVWAIALPQVVEGMATILVLYGAVRRVAGAGAGIVAAVVMASSPIVILLDHGNISDSLLILLLVAAADAATRAFTSGRLGPLLWCGFFVGLAFQAKMLQAWIVLPAFAVAYLVASPVTSFLRRALHVVGSGLLALAVSLSYMTFVSVVPSSSRPYVDGSCDDSIYSQVFSYNGITRLGDRWLASSGCSPPSRWIHNLSLTAAREGLSTAASKPGWDRLLHGTLGRDDVWLLLPAVVSMVALLAARRRQPRTDPLRGAVLLWGIWLVVTFGVFSAGELINSYYVAALLPAVGVLCGIGASTAWHRRHHKVVRIVVLGVVVGTVAVDVLLVPGYAGVRDWVLAGVALGGLSTVAILGASFQSRHDSVWSRDAGLALGAATMLLCTSWASALVVVEGLGPFDSPFAPAAVNQNTQVSTSDFPVLQRQLVHYVAGVPERQAVDVFETSRSASEDALASGREFLPIGGFTGVVPSPTLGQFEHDVRRGLVRQVTLATAPLTANTVLLWVFGHCHRTPTAFYDQYSQAEFTVYLCSPADTSSTGPT